MKAENTTTNQQAQTSAKVLQGTVVSGAMTKTIVVKIERKFKHPTLGKIVRTFKKYKVHDENNDARSGDVVEIAECRPLSKTKHMKLERIVKRSDNQSEAR